MFVLGTAGHVDHGKSSFLKALTGMEPDRLPEEKARGLTINLNFLWSDFTSFGRVGFVDVPGHHRFVGNMISGVGELSGFILIVAADDGWMPQTEEHIQILEGLGITQGILVISKVDLVEEAQAREVERDAQEKLNRAFRKLFPAFSFSKDRPDLLHKCREGIEGLLKSLTLSQTKNSPRVWVDRVFLPQGKGIIATGTLSEGPLVQGQKLFLWPGEKEANLKNIQCYQTDTAKAEPVSRVALQLSQIEAARVSKGSLISAQSTQTTQKSDAQIFFLGEPPKKNISLKAYWGTLEEPCLVIPSSTPVGRIQFERPVPLRFGERFLFRTTVS